MKNYYEILEVDKRASKEIIEKAYKVLIKKYHPDLYNGEISPNIEMKIRDINEAYKILSNDFLREQYDREIKKYNSEEYIEKNKENYNKNIKDNSESNITENTKGNSVDNENKNNVGSIGSGIELLREIFKIKPKKVRLKNLQREDWLAFGITVGIMILLGIILWFVPFTNKFMRELTIENPLFSWIGKLF